MTHCKNLARAIGVALAGIFAQVGYCACLISLPLAPAMQNPTTTSERVSRDMSVFMLNGLVDGRQFGVEDQGGFLIFGCDGTSADLQEKIADSIGPEGKLDRRLLQGVFDEYFLVTKENRGQGDVMKRTLAEFAAATGFGGWPSSIVPLSAIKRKSRRIYRSPDGTRKISVSETLESQTGDPAAAVTETEVAVRRSSGSWDFYSYNSQGDLVNYSTFPSGDGPSPRMCMSCHYNPTAREINRFLPD